MVLTAGMAMSGWLLGGQVLDVRPLKADLPVLGTVKATGALPFDIGVYLLVVGVVLLAFEGFGQSGRSV